ncbi:hypothetical protein QW131_23540 [Roseibium salinum]|nr:hypothetical protein [Roseibium salinum]
MTTTGSTILTGLDVLPPGILLWRSLLQWIGGIGVIAIGIWLLPGLRVGGSQLFALESSEKNQQALRSCWSVRLPAAGDLRRADGVLRPALPDVRHELLQRREPCHDHGLDRRVFRHPTSHSGSFRVLPPIGWPFFFMLASAVPFLYLIRSIEHRRFGEDIQIILLLGIVAAAAFTVFLLQRFMVEDAPFQTFTFAAFNVVSVITTTGYAANDYLQFGTAVIAIFFSC